MKCEQCPISLVCWSGKLTGYAQNMPETFLCPYCGNFRTAAFEEDETRDEYRAGLRGFQCEQRQMTDSLKNTWRTRSLSRDGYHRIVITRKYQHIQGQGDIEHEVISALSVPDPGPGDILWLKPCPFCRH